MTTILFGVTSPHTALAFLDGHIKELADAGAMVHLVCGEADGIPLDDFSARNSATVHALPISRDVRATQDVRALLHLDRIVRRIRPDIVSAGTPKMSLLLLVTAWLRRVPRRVYVCHGLRHEGMEGQRRAIQELIERSMCLLATETAAVSESVREGLIDVGVRPSSVRVIGHGSADGVDPHFFEPVPGDVSTAFRETHRIEGGRPTAAFVGRLTRDKGVDALVAAASRLTDVTFVVAGRPEPAGQADEVAIAQLEALPNVRMLGRIDDVRPLYAVSDMLILPTRREGLATVIIEAAAAGVPTIAMDATGTRDVVENDVTGLLVTQGDVDEFVAAIGTLSGDSARRHRLGRSAQRDVLRRFSQPMVRDLWREFYLQTHDDT